VDIYYNKGIETAILGKNNTMLKRQYFSYLASITTNIAITKSFDIFAEFTFQQSIKNITQENYFNTKKVRNFGSNFGVKYYLKPREQNNQLENYSF